MAEGPDPNFIEPLPYSGGSGSSRAESFSTYLESGPFVLAPPEKYACEKAALFPDEGGPVLRKVDVPDEVVALAVDEVYFPLSQGLVQFDAGAGLEELRAVWSRLIKVTVPVEGP